MASSSRNLVIFLGLFGTFVPLVLALDLGQHEVETERDKRLFSLFSIVTFKNQGCRGTGGASERNGTCYTSTECRNKGGLAQGNCAAGFGVCCLFIVSSTSSAITENCTYIQNPGFPSPYSDTTALTYTIQKCQNDVCSIRLDFVSFQTVGPADSGETNGGACQDVLMVSGTTGLSSPPICGLNTGQHIYMDVGPAAGATATLAFTFLTSVTSTTRAWEIKATQVECSSPSRPESGCLQQHNGIQGRIETFNFADSSTQAHLASQKYSICIRPEMGYCCISYSLCADDNSWTIDSIILANAEVDTLCSADYIGIEGASGACTSSTTATFHGRFCGGKFNTFAGATNHATQICDCTLPFVVDVKTNAADEAGINNRGVCLEYKQIPCSSS